MKETDLIAALETLSPSNPNILVGIGDDAAVVKAHQRDSLVCTDMLMEGVHFKLATATPAQIGHKALAVNLSDIAAMGGSAESAYISLAIPRRLANREFIAAFYRGVQALASTFGVAIAGGDTNIWDGPLVVNVTAIGLAHKKGPILRAGAAVGDTIFVTGPLGGSIEGHHLDFRPRLDEAKLLLDHFDVRSMMDISDGLAKDLRELARQSEVAAHLNPEALPRRAHIAAKKNALEHVLTDGEDFELCFTLDAIDSARLLADSRFQFCTAIGTMHEGAGLYWQGATPEPITLRGYEHGEDA